MLTKLAALFKPMPRYSSKGGVTKIKRDGYGSDWFSTVAEVKARDHYCCVFCKEPEDKKNGVYHDVHHIISLNRGGKTVKSNLATTCKKCHSKRHTHLHVAGYNANSRPRGKNL